MSSDATTDVVYEIGADGTIAWISPAVTDLLGWQPDQLQGQPARDLIHPLDLERVDALRAVFYRDGVEHNDVTCMACTASGGYREVKLRARGHCSMRTARSSAPPSPSLPTATPCCGP